MSTAIVLNFDKAAKEYINYAQIQHVVAEKLSAYIPKSRLGNAIEYGAGSGIFTKHLSPWLGKVIATDASQAMCLEGKKNNPSIEWERVDLRQPKEGPWDYVFSSSVLQWVDDPVNVFKVWKKSFFSKL
jgi:malonyl-CoA O-methyltransferase